MVAGEGSLEALVVAVAADLVPDVVLVGVLGSLGSESVEEVSPASDSEVVQRLEVLTKNPFDERSNMSS